jgi:chemotaxis protein CheD
LPTPKYGNIAIVKLIEKVLAFPGTKRGNLVAKVFGGASMWDKGESLLSVGDRNIELAMDLLEKQGLPILARDLGGRAGRKLIFNTADGSVLMRRQRVIPGVK